MQVFQARAGRRAHRGSSPRVRAALGFAFSVAVGTLVLPSTGASAQPNCASDYINLFTGMQTSGSDLIGSTWEGASALLVPRYGNLCDYNPYYYDPRVQAPQSNSLSAWAMLSSGGNCQVTCGYAQTGYYRGWGQQTYFYFEYHSQGRPSSEFTRSVEYVRGPLSYGGINRYWVQFVYGGPEGAHLRLNIDSTVIGETPWNPYSPNGLWTGGPAFSAVFSGETHYQGDDMPGTASVPALFQGLELQLGNGQWTTQMPSFFGTGPGGYRYGFQRDTTRSFKIWTFGV